MGGVGTVIPTEQGGLLVLTRTAIDDASAPAIFGMSSATLSLERSLRFAMFVADDASQTSSGGPRVFRHGSEVCTAVLIGGHMSGETS